MPTRIEHLELARVLERGERREQRDAVGDRHQIVIGGMDEEGRGISAVTCVSTDPPWRSAANRPGT